MRYHMAIAAVALLSAAPAQAQEATMWSGPRVEAILGYDSADVSGQAGNGVVYGGGLGYDFRSGGAVLGIEGEVTSSDAERCTANYGQNGATLCARMRTDFYIGGRAGFLVGPGALVYAKAGYSGAWRHTLWTNGTVGADVDFREAVQGFRLGGGLELALGHAGFVKTEYRYSNYGQGNDFVGGTALSPVLLPGDRHDRHQGVVGFGFRF